MSRQLYVPYFAINPYGGDVPTDAMDAAREALETELGGACHVLAAKAAFENAGGLPALWRGIHTRDITRWTKAAQGAVMAAFRVQLPAQASIEEMELMEAAYLDVVPATRYAYTEGQWLDVFMAHFGMSDYCGSQQEALTAGRHWLAAAREACPIAAAEQEIRERTRSGQAPATGVVEDGAASAALSPAGGGHRGARACN